MAEAGPGLTETHILSIPMPVNAFPLVTEVLDALEASLSPERMTTYLAAAGGDREQALRLYTWNTAVSAAFYGPLQGLEVALRNAMNRELARIYGPDWYDNPGAGLDLGALERIGGAKKELAKGGYPIDPPHLVAALSFGFWVTLLGSGGRSQTPGSPKRNYEMTLWRPALHRAFPHAKLSRRAAHQPLDFPRTFRNRIAHHEPIFNRHLEADYRQILAVTGWICPSTRNWIAHHSRVEQMLQMAKDSDGIAF